MEKGRPNLVGIGLSGETASWLILDADATTGMLSSSESRGASSPTAFATSIFAAFEIDGSNTFEVSSRGGSMMS